MAVGRSSADANSAGSTFYQLHLLYDKHYDEQVELVDSIAERIQLLGGVSLAMTADVAKTTQIERPPPAVAKKFWSSCRDYSMLTKSSLAKSESWRAEYPPLGTTVQTISLSARCCAEMSFKCGF